MFCWCLSGIYKHWAVYSEDLRLLACWDCGFESCQWHGYLSLVSVVFSQVDISATSRSLVQGSPTKCSVSSRDLKNQAALVSVGLLRLGEKLYLERQIWFCGVRCISTISVTARDPAYIPYQTIQTLMKSKKSRLHDMQEIKWDRIGVIHRQIS